MSPKEWIGKNVTYSNCICVEKLKYVVHFRVQQVWFQTQVCKVGVVSLQGRWEFKGVDILGSHCTYYIGEALQGRRTVHAVVILHSTCPSRSGTTPAWTGRHYLPSVSPRSPLYSPPGIYSGDYIVLAATNVYFTAIRATASFTTLFTVPSIQHGRDQKGLLRRTCSDKVW